MPRRSDAKERLVEAAREVVYRQGWSATTLAHVAEQAQIPLGNLYYHFRSKDALASAVIGSRRADLDAMVETCEEHDDPVDRLVAFLDGSISMRDDVARSGCPYATLAGELEKTEGTLAAEAGALVGMQVDWATEQFKAMGKGRRSRALALELIAGAQGASVLTHALGDATIMRTRLRALQRWVREQVSSPARRVANRVR